MAQPNPRPEARQVGGSSSRFLLARRFLTIGLISAALVVSSFALAQIAGKKAPPVTAGAKTPATGPSGSTASSLNTGPQVKTKDSIQSIPTIQPRVPIKPRI